jgi:hypothetical protein
MQVQSGQRGKLQSWPLIYTKNGSTDKRNTQSTPQKAGYLRRNATVEETDAFRALTGGICTYLTGKMGTENA